MADFGKIITNPVVLASGAALGLFILLSKNGAAATPTPVAPQYSSVASALNQASMSAVTRQYEIAANLGAKKIDADVQTQLGFLAYFKNESDNNTAIRLQTTESNAGVLKSVIAAQAAQVIDQQQNAARTAQTYLQTDAQKYISNNSVRIAEVQAKAAKHAANVGAISAVVGTIGKVVAAGL